MTKIKDYPLKIGSYNLSYKRCHANEVKRIEYHEGRLIIKIDDINIMGQLFDYRYRQDIQNPEYEYLLRNFCNEINKYINMGD